jgi:hypothetical protein
MAFLVNNSKKKSQIFIFDLIFATFMVFVSIGIFFTYFSETRSNSNLYSINYEILDSFTTTNINSLNDEVIREMFKTGEIRNKDNTIAQQVAEFFYLGKEDLARDLTDVFVKNYISLQMNYNISIRNETDSLVLKTSNNNLDFQNASIASASNRLIIGFNDKDSFYGPFDLSIKIWQ